MKILIANYNIINNSKQQYFIGTDKKINAFIETDGNDVIKNFFDKYNLDYDDLMYDDRRIIKEKTDSILASYVEYRVINIVQL